MRSNQAAVQRRVNNARNLGNQGPSPNASYSTSSSSNTSTAMNSNGYAPYPPSQYPVPSQASSAPSQMSNPTPSMPPKLTPHQQLQFILNALGDRISKLEMAQKNGTDASSSPSPFANYSAAQPGFGNASVNNGKNYDQEIAQIQEGMRLLKGTVDGFALSIQEIKTTLASSQTSQTQSVAPFDPEVIAKPLQELSGELDTRTTLLSDEINKVKDMMLHLQSDVITVFKEKILMEKEDFQAQDQDQDQDQDQEPQENELGDDLENNVQLEYHHSDSNLISLPSDINSSFVYPSDQTDAQGSLDIEDLGDHTNENEAEAEEEA